MNLSGLKVDDTLRSAFAQFQGSTAAYLKVKIQAENFVVAETGAAAADAKAAFTAISASLKPADPAYIITKKPNTSKYVVILYVPDNSVVREKMIYPASVQGLKQGLGVGNFAPDYHCTTVNEVSVDALEHAHREVKDTDVMTNDEIIRQQEILAAHLSLSHEKTNLMHDIPLNAPPELVNALKSIAEEKATAVIFHLNDKFDSFVLENNENKSLSSLDNIRAAMPAKDARYIVMKWAHAHPETKANTVANMFLYYCPEGTPFKAKMPYATFKREAVRLATAAGLEITKQYECADVADLNESAVLLDLYPKLAEKKVMAKPKATGKGPARLISGAKFNPAAKK